MSPYEAIRAQLSATVPFANHVGAELIEVGDGTARAQLAQTDATVNHIGSQHAGALFTVGEAASGAAMAGGIAPEILSVRPVAKAASIEYRRIAKGTITAHATTDQPGTALLEALRRDGKAVFAVSVSLRDEADEEVATMRVDWHVSKARD